MTDYPWPPPHPGNRAATAGGGVPPVKDIAPPQPRRRRWLGVAVAAMSLVLVVVLLLSLNSPQEQPPPGNGPLTGAVVGATIADWERQLGTAESPTQEMADEGFLFFRRCPGAENFWEYAVVAVDDRVTQITRNDCDEAAMPRSVAQREMRQFLPRDARRAGELRNADGEPVVVWRSRALGRLLPRRQFRDCDGEAVARGTLSFVKAETYWFLGPGTCP